MNSIRAGRRFGVESRRGFGYNAASMNELSRIVETKGRRFLLRVEDSADHRDYRKYEEIREEIWRFPDDHMAGTRNLVCESFLHEGTSLFIGVFAEDGGIFPLDYEHLVGFSYGFVGIRDKGLGFRDSRNLRFYSQYAGAKRAFRSFGLGVLLKEFQRDVLLRVYGIAEVICTFDPQTGVNANRNIQHFGMRVLEYRVAVYPEFAGKLNREDVPTDRLLMSWDLERPPSVPAFELEPLLDDARKVIRAAKRALTPEGGTAEAEIVLGLRTDLEAPRLLLQIPLDFYRLLEETAVGDPDIRRIPADWRMATREAFLALMGRGYRIVDFRKSAAGENFYILDKTEGS